MRTETNGRKDGCDCDLTTKWDLVMAGAILLILAGVSFLAFGGG